MESLLSKIDAVVFFEKMEAFNATTIFKISLDSSKSPLETYRQQPTAGKTSILRKMKTDFESDFETTESLELEKQIKQVEKALRQL